MKKKILLILIIILAVIWLSYTLLNMGLDELQNLQLEKIDLSTIENGLYHGQCKIGRWRNKVVLRVYQGKIVEITFSKDQLIKNDDVRNEMIKRLKEQEQLPVDAVAGATVTSNAYMKAVEDALKHGVRLPPKF